MTALWSVIENLQSVPADVSILRLSGGDPHMFALKVGILLVCGADNGYHVAGLLEAGRQPERSTVRRPLVSWQPATGSAKGHRIRRWPRWPTPRSRLDGDGALFPSASSTRARSLTS
jgi:hypothetical protein